MGYPTGQELAAWMVAQKLLSVVPEDLTALDAAAEGIAETWESSTFWTPFLVNVDEQGDPIEETRKFDGPEGYRLYPGVGIVSVSSLKVGGAVLAEDADFFLMDRKRGKYAYQSIEFAKWVAGTRRLVEITGVFGVTKTLPADVKLALLSLGAVGLSTDSTSTGALKREKAGPVEREYDVAGGAKTAASRLQATYDAAVTAWRRTV